MLASVVVFYGSDRFRDSVSPVFVMFAGLAASALASKWLTARPNLHAPCLSKDSKLALTS